MRHLITRDLFYSPAEIAGTADASLQRRRQQLKAGRGLKRG